MPDLETVPWIYSALDAGQGYVWLAHREIKSAAWPLAVHGKRLWEDILDCNNSLNASSVEWQVNGSLLLATNTAEEQQLLQRKEMLREAGVDAEFLNKRALLAKEPALGDAVHSGLLVQSDAQLVSALFCLQWLFCLPQSPDLLLSACSVIANISCGLNTDY